MASQLTGKVVPLKARKVAAVSAADLRSKSRSEAVFANLRDAIWEGRFAPGERIPEEEIARSLGVSRTPVREALRRLQERGILTVGAGRTLVVAELSKSQVLELYAMREILEGSAASGSRRSIAATMRRCSASDSLRRFGTRKVLPCSSASASCIPSSVAIR